MSSPRNLHILMISADRNIFREGSEANARMKDYASLAEELHIIVFTRGKDKFQKTEIAKNCIVYPTASFSRWLYVSDAYFLAKRLFSPEESDQNISLITAQDPFETGLAGFLIARMLRRPLHLEVHTDLFAPAFSKSAFLNVLIAKFLFHRHADIRVVSERVKTSIFREMNFTVNGSPRITVLPDFVDTEKFINTPPSFNLREEYPGFDLLVLAVTRLEKEKNVMRAIHLMEDVGKDKPDLSIGFIIVGAGSEEAALQAYVKRSGIGDRVFFRGYQKDLVSHYKTADILLVTSEYEAYGEMFVEAAASGCPILTVDVGAASDILFSWNAIICPEKDNACLFRHLETLASERVVRETFLASARAGVKRMKFQTKEEYLAAYKRMWIDAAMNDAFAPII